MTRHYSSALGEKISLGNSARGSRSKRTQTEKAYLCIKEGIVRGEIQEGEFLSEREIMKKYRIGRTPFREACNRLHHEHLLEAVAHRGYLVPQMSLQEVRDLFELRMLVEGALAELATARASAGEIEELAGLARVFRKDQQDRAEANKNFHMHLATMAHNRELLRLENSVLERTRRLAYHVARSIGVQGQELSLQNLHQPIVDALRRRDGAAARRAVIHDIQQAQAILLGMAGGALGKVDGAPEGRGIDSKSEAPADRPSTPDLQ